MGHIEGVYKLQDIMHLNNFPIYLEILSILLLQKGGAAGHSRPVEAVWLKLVNGKLKTEEL